MVQHRRSVVSPRQVMVAMEHYMPTFRLTCQQVKICSIKDEQNY